MTMTSAFFPLRYTPLPPAASSPSVPDKTSRYPARRTAPLRSAVPASSPDQDRYNRYCWQAPLLFSRKKDCRDWHTELMTPYPPARKHEARSITALFFITVRNRIAKARSAHSPAGRHEKAVCQTDCAETGAARSVRPHMPGKTGSLRRSVPDLRISHKK